MSEKRYTLIIADDEDAIRGGMCNYINWDRMGFRVEADFEDGESTIAYLQEHTVNVVLTDIQMAGASGLDVAEYVYKNCPDTKVVILSGYKEFEYAKRAIAYNVVDYITKPLHVDELEKIFAQIHKTLEASSQERERMRSREQEFNELLPELQEQFWTSVLLGVYHKGDGFTGKRELLGLNFSTGTPCGVVKAEFTMDQEVAQQYFLEKEHRYNLWNNVFSGENEGITVHPVYLKQDDLRLVVTTQKAIDLQDFRERLGHELQLKRSIVQQLLGLEIRFTIEQTFGNMSDMASHYSNAYLQAPAYSGSNESADKQPIDYDRLQQKYTLIMNTIDAGDFEQLDYLAGNIFYEFRDRPLLEIKNVLLDMFAMIQQKFMKMDTALWKSMKEQISYQEMMRATDRESLKKICLSQLHEITNLMSSHQNDASRNIVEQIKAYLDAHYHEEISLDMLAERYYLNASYLSRLFKQSTGSTLTDYLASQRIEESKKLLLSGKYKVYEVSQKVGYRNDKYFFRVFRSYTGMSPSEFLRSSIHESVTS